MTESRALDIFLSSLKSESTKTNYLYWLDRYMKHYNKTSYDELIKEPQEKIQKDIEDYVLELRRMRTTRAMVKASIYALFHLFAMNRVLLNEKVIKKLIPEQVGKVGGGAYSTQDVRKIIQSIDDTKIKKHKKWYFRKPRAKALVLFLASSGMRLGAIPDLMYGDIETIEDCYQVTVYAGTKSEYITFISPEARIALDDYISHFKGWESDHQLFGMEYSALRLCLYRLVKKAKVSMIMIHPQTKWDRRINGEKKDRHKLSVPTVHGLRKRWNTILKSNKDINSNLAELMLGHTTAIKLDEAYLKPTNQSLFNEYKKAIPELTVMS